MTIAVRPFQPADAAAVTEICYQTGYLGASAEGRFGDRVLFAQLFALANATHSPASCFVAFAGGGRVVGYCVAAPDTARFDRWFNDEYRWTIARRVVSATLWRHPADLVRLVRWSTAPRPAGEEPPLDAYPAHLHMNVLPGHQRRGIGQSLLSATLQHLRSAGIPGVHLRTSSAHASALAFYEKTGFTRLGVRDGNLWRVPGVRSICMGLQLRCAETSNA